MDNFFSGRWRRERRETGVANRTLWPPSAFALLSHIWVGHSIVVLIIAGYFDTITHVWWEKGIEKVIKRKSVFFFVFPELQRVTFRYGKILLMNS